MCGICGVAGLEDKSIIRDMNKTLSHRGPDRNGFFTAENISLGHRRLSIIDLSEKGRQPMHNEDETIWIVFNGEIYNFQEIKSKLEEKGHKFFSNSDTEVIIHAYEKYGEECVKLFNGMFAFAIWDSNKKKLFIARDRLGQKPLYYCKLDKKLIFASELKAILQFPGLRRDVELVAIKQYLALGYVPEPLTIFKGIYKLMPSHYLTFLNNNITIKRYWDLKFNGFIKDENVLKKKLKILLEEATRMRLISDVPLGAFLSGGLDSSILVGIMSKMSQEPIKTFSIGFEESDYNETKYARIVADHFNTEHKEFIISVDNLKLLSKLVKHFDEPFADVSSIPTYLVSKMTKRHVTVALSGDGADEAFAGYRRYWHSNLTTVYEKLPKIIRHDIFPKIASKLPATKRKYDPSRYIQKFVDSSLLPEAERHLNYLAFFNGSELNELTKYQNENGLKKRFTDLFNKLDTKDTLLKSQYVDINSYLSGDILVKADRMSMATSLEVRSPFLDYRIFELSAQTPSNLKIKRFNSKYILKNVFDKLLPKKIIQRKKSGFVMPISRWLDKNLKDYSIDLIKRSDLLNRNQALKVIVGNYNAYQKWILFNFVLWEKEYLKK